MVAPVVGAALRAAQAAKKLKNVKKPKPKKDTEEMKSALKDFKKGKPKDELAPAKVMAAGTAGIATQASHSPLSMDKKPKPENKKASGGLTKGQRKIARGCGKVQRRKKTLYT